MSMPFMFFQLVQLMFCSRDFTGERIDKTPRKGEMLFSKTIIPTGRKQWHPTPVLLLGKSHGWRSLLGCNPWGR